MAAERLRRFLVAGAGLALILLIPARAAQETVNEATVRDWSQDVPAHLAAVTGEVTLVRDGRLEPAEANQILLAGDRLRTQGGRAQILFVDGSTLAADEDTLLDLLSDSLVRLIEGRVRLAIPRTTEDLEYRVDTAAGCAEIRAAGEYRVQLGKDRRGKTEVELIVYRGSAELANDFGRTLVRAGRHAVTSADTEPSLPYSINSAAWDDFDRWVDGLQEAHVAPATSVSANYLPEEERYYATTLDAYGTWDDVAPYGPVWYPRVHVGWQPYAMGRWSYTGYYGWGWVGIDHWAWPTYHYGRWGISAGGWYWIPGRAWGPAWVAWGGAPGYVGWCPLGWDGYPVIGFGRPTPYRYDPWSAWTVMPSRAWRHNVWVNEHRVPYGGLPPGARGGFSEHRAGPAPLGGDIPARATAPIGPPTRPRDVASPRARTMPTSADRAGRTAGPEAGFPAASPSRVVMPPARDTAPRASANDRGGAQSGFPSIRAFPQTTATGSGGSRGEPSRAIMPGADVTSVGPTRAIPRQAEPERLAPPPMSGGRTRAAPRAPDQDSVGSAAPPVAGPQPNRGRAIERNPAPQMPPAEPRPVAPPRGSSGVAPSAPSPGPPPAPPSAAPRGHAVQPSAPPASPPSAPPSRGGGAGGGQGAAVPRRGGGRG